MLCVQSKNTFNSYTIEKNMKLPEKVDFWPESFSRAFEASAEIVFSKYWGPKHWLQKEFCHHGAPEKAKTLI